MENLKTYQFSKLKIDKTPRPAQIDLLNFTINTIKSNKKFVLVDAPVGAGKSVYSVMFMDWFKTNYDASAQFDILTNSKLLQEQYTNEFNFMNSLWGKGSYHCDTHNTDCGTGSEWCKIQGNKCESCPYSQAKSKFEMEDIALTNFHLFLTYMVYMPQAWKRSSRVLIIDEAHTFENVFCDFISTKISAPLLKRNGLTDEETQSAMSTFGDYPEDLTIKEYVDIINTDFLNIIKTVINRLDRDAKDGNNQAVTNLQSLGNNFLKWESLLKQYTEQPDNWILEADRIKKYDKTGKITGEYIEMSAQPIWAYPYLEELVWSKYDYVVCMSGTILNKDIFSKMNGIDPNLADYISLDSTFPVENRPIYYFHKTGKQTYKTKEITWQKQKLVLSKILKKHKNNKGIIHSSNYEIMGWVEKEFDENRILTHDSTNRNEILQQHYNTDRPTVLCSPSMMVGIDLAGDFSRHQTILKMPYPNLSSKKIKQRMNTMSEYYAITTVRDLIQSSGRSVRSSTDHADTYILDSCFSDLLKWNSHYFPQWFLNAIQYVD